MLELVRSVVTGQALILETEGGANELMQNRCVDAPGADPNNECLYFQDFKANIFPTF